MDLGLRGKVGIVTGASRGIGRALVDTLVAEGLHVVAGARDTRPLKDIDGVVSVDVDLSTSEGARSLVRAALESYGSIDCLVNNVGGGQVHIDGFASVSDDDWYGALDLILLSAVRTTRAALSSLKASRGAIVNIASLNGRSPAPQAPEYSAMKAALISVSRSLALELASCGVRVNVVTPGPILTDLHVGPKGAATALGVSNEEYVGGIEAEAPVRRIGHPDEVASMVVALLSPRMGYITGADVVVDGGELASILDRLSSFGNSGIYSSDS